MNLQAIHEAVAARIDTVPGVRASPFPLDDIPTGNAVAVFVAPGAQWVNFHEAFAKGLALVNLVVTPYIQLVSIRSAHESLQRLCSSGLTETGSIIDALMNTDRTLGDVCDDLVMDEVVNVQAVTSQANVRYLSGDLNMRVLVKRNT